MNESDLKKLIHGQQMANIYGTSGAPVRWRPSPQLAAQLSAAGDDDDDVEEDEDELDAMSRLEQENAFWYHLTEGNF